MKRRNKYGILILGFWIGLQCAGCSSSADPIAERLETESISPEAVQTEDAQTEGTRTENAQMENALIETESSEEEQINGSEAIVSAITEVSGLSSFCVNTDMYLKLDGKYIRMETNVHTVIDITQGEKPEDLLMTMRTTSDQDDFVSHASYRDGWYYTDDQNGKRKVQKSPEEVMQMVTEVTAMVTEAADDMTIISEEENGTSRVYTFTLPSDMAEEYLKMLMELASEQEDSLRGAKVMMDTLELQSTVNSDGVLEKQKLSITGSMKKSIFKVPAEGRIAVTFENTAEK